MVDLVTLPLFRDTDKERGTEAYTSEDVNEGHCHDPDSRYNRQEMGNSGACQSLLSFC